MYVNSPQVALFDGLGALDELPGEERETVGQEAVIPAGTELRFAVGSIFTVEDASRIRYADHKGCAPSTVLLFDGGTLFVRLSAPVSVGYGEDGNLRIASSSDASGDTMARGELVGAVDPTGADMVCNIPAVVSRPARVAVHDGARIMAMVPAAGVVVPPVVRATDGDGNPAPEVPCAAGQYRDAEGNCVQMITPVVPTDTSSLPPVPAPKVPWYKRPVIWGTAAAVVAGTGIGIAVARRRRRRG